MKIIFGAFIIYFLIGAAIYVFECTQSDDEMELGAFFIESLAWPLKIF